MITLSIKQAILIRLRHKKPNAERQGPHPKIVYANNREAYSDTKQWYTQIDSTQRFSLNTTNNLLNIWQLKRLFRRYLFFFQIKIVYLLYHIILH